MKGCCAGVVRKHVRACLCLGWVLLACGHIRYRAFGRLIDMGILRAMTGTGLGEARARTGASRRGGFAGTFGLTADYRTLPVGTYIHAHAVG